jgi:hypothetical protein
MDEVVVTRYQLSNTEQALRQRFLTNQRTQPTQPPPRREKEPEVNDGQLKTFVKEMQETMKQQATGSLAAQLLHSQASIMQQQVDLLKDGQRQMHSVLANLPRQDSSDTKRALAEVMAPIQHQFLEFKQLYESQRQAAELMEQQLTHLKTAIHTKKPTETLRRTLDTSIDKFADQQATIKAHARQAHHLIDEVKERATDLPFAQNIDFMMEKLQHVQVNTEKVEKELMDRYQRIVLQQQRLATVPSDVKIGQYESSMLRIAKALGGEFDYEGGLEELEFVRSRRNELLIEFKSTAPVYPKLVKPMLEEAQLTQPKARRGKPVPMLPQPVQSSKRSSRKPSAYSKIVTTPRAPPQIVKPVDQPRPIIDNIDFPEPTLPRPPEPTLPRPSVKEVSPKPAVTPPPQSSVEPTPIEVKVEPPVQPPPPPTKMSKEIPPSSLPQRPEVRSNLRPDDLISRDVEPVNSGRAMKTDTGRNQLLEERVLDAVTQAVLCSKLKAPMKQRLAISHGASRWLGDDHLDILIRDGIFVDSETIEKEGRQLLTQIIQHALEDHSPNEIQEDEYQSDFEAEEEDEEEQIAQPPQKYQAEKPSVQTPPPQRTQEPAMLRESGMQADLQIPAAKDDELKALLQPRMLGMMSAAAVKQYVSSLVESGHISRDSTAVPVQSQLVTPVVSQERPQSEVERFLESGVGAELQQIIREEGTRVTPQRVMEKFVSRHLTPSTSDTAVQTADDVPEPYPTAPTPIQREPFEEAKVYPQGRPFLDIKYAPGQEFKTKPTEFDVFGKPYDAYPQRRIDLEREQELLREEQTVVRMPIDLPGFKPRAFITSAELNFSDSDSQLSSVNLESPKLSIENPEFVNGFIEFVRRAGDPNKSLSEGEINILSSVSSGEVRPSIVESSHEDTFDLSEGELES